jgi:hypothetical protein
MKLISVTSIWTVVLTLCCPTGYNMNCHPHTHSFSTIFCLLSFCVLFFISFFYSSRHFPASRPQILHNIFLYIQILFEDCMLAIWWYIHVTLRVIAQNVWSELTLVNRFTSKYHMLLLVCGHWEMPRPGSKRCETKPEPVTNVAPPHRT